MNSVLFNFVKTLAEENIFSSSETLVGTFAMIEFIIYAILMCFCLMLAVAAYVFEGIGLSRMLKKVGYARPWHAWVPFANEYAVGSLADMYDDGKPKSNLAREFLTVNIVTGALALAMLVISLPLMLVGLGAKISALYSLGAILFLGLYIATIVFSVKTIVKMYVCYWRIFRIFHPALSVLYLMLSIFVSSVAVCFIIFFISKREPQNLRSDDDNENKFDDFGSAEPQNPYFYE